MAIYNGDIKLFESERLTGEENGDHEKIMKPRSQPVPQPDTECS